MQKFRILTCCAAITMLSAPALPAPQNGKVSPSSQSAKTASKKSAEPKLKLSEAWAFKAFCAAYGRFKATITEDAVMVDNGVFHYSIQGPNYEIFKVHNPENKSYIQTTVTQYATQWASPIKYPPFKKVGTAKMHDLQCIHYVCDTYHRNTTIDSWYTNDIPAKRGLTGSLCKVCALPTGYGLPVKVVFKHPGKDELVFDLLNIEKTRVEVESLLVPKDYRFMKDQALFFLSNEDGSNSGIDELMFSDKPKKRTHRKNRMRKRSRTLPRSLAL